MQLLGGCIVDRIKSPTSRDDLYWSLEMASSITSSVGFFITQQMKTNHTSLQQEAVLHDLKCYSYLQH